MRFFDIKYQAGEGLQRQPRANLAAAVIGGVLAINAVAFGITSISNDHHYKVHSADNKTITLNRPEASPSKTNNGGGASAPAGDNSGPASAPGTYAGSGETTASIQGGSASAPSSGGGYQPAIVGGRGGGSTTGGTPPPCICQTITGLADPALQTITQTTTALP